MAVRCERAGDEREPNDEHCREPAREQRVRDGDTSDRAQFIWPQREALPDASPRYFEGRRKEGMPNHAGYRQSHSYCRPNGDWCANAERVNPAINQRLLSPGHGAAISFSLRLAIGISHV